MIPAPTSSKDCRVLTACAACGGAFMRHSSLIRHCSPKCAIKLLALKAKAERADLKKRKEAAKPRSKWLQEAQTAVNKWVRLRDAWQSCISCGRSPLHGGSWDAGHYLTVGANAALRFEPLNIHKQCVACNQHLHGNAIKYRVGLIQRIGVESVEWLEGPHDPKKYTIPDLKQIIALYRQKAKELEQ